MVGCAGIEPPSSPHPATDNLKGEGLKEPPAAGLLLSWQTIAIFNIVVLR